MSRANVKIAKRLLSIPQNSPAYNKEYPKGLKIFESECMSKHNTNDEKLYVLVELSRLVPDIGQDILNRWRDSLPFLKGEDIDRMLELLTMVIKSSKINSHERLFTAVVIYNRGYVSICYDCFVVLAQDPYLLLDHKIDACRYLFGSCQDEYRQIAQECLLEILDTQTYPSSHRYQIIAGYLPNTGIGTLFNRQKIRVPYDEEFVYTLQINFFSNNENGIRERLLSAEHLIHMKTVDVNERNDIFQKLLEISQDQDYDENTRADAVDIVYRNSEAHRLKSLEIIKSIGTSTGGKTLYQDSQNIHQFNEQIDPFIEKMVQETSGKVESYDVVYQQVSDYLQEHVPERASRFKCFKALNRIHIDTAIFSKYRLTPSEIFVYVWTRIHSYPAKQHDNLLNSLIQELIMMGDTCGTGHVGRMLNVFSGHENVYTITWAEQIKSNIYGRFNARINKLSEEMRDSIAMGMSNMGDSNDEKAYTDFITKVLPEIQLEMAQEFVDAGHLRLAEFEQYFSNGVKELGY
jgi:hypothetical protein